MPNYNTDLLTNPTGVSIAPGDAVTVWNAEQPTPGAGGISASQRLALVFRGDTDNGFSFSGFFSGAPGAFEIDVQVSDVADTDLDYQTVSNGNITTVDSTNNTFHFDGATVRARWVRALMRSRANAVNVTGTFRKG